MLKSVLYLPMTNLLHSAAKTPHLILICFSEGSHLSVLCFPQSGTETQMVPHLKQGDF